jgi:chemotaxis protein CheZ
MRRKKEFTAAIEKSPRDQLRDMADCVRATKGEIASIRHPQASPGADRLTSAALELDAIATATEDATNDILDAAERINDLTRTLRDSADGASTRAMADEISGLITSIFEKCTFQDIAGQRIAKVVKTIDYLDQRVSAMIDIWGDEGFKDVPLRIDDVDEDEKLLEGPQTGNKGISQDDIDDLFA